MPERREKNPVHFTAPLQNHSPMIAIIDKYENYCHLTQYLLCGTGYHAHYGPRLTSIYPQETL
jgi:hypothetical protein